MSLEYQKQFFCPYCGESNTLSVEASAGTQEFVVDCEICCAPIAVKVKVSDNEILTVEARKENE